MYSFYKKAPSQMRRMYERKDYMKTVYGVYTSAKIFTEQIEDYALAQIRLLCDNVAFEGCTIRVMPDVHPGKVGTIGFTSSVRDKIMPNVVGIDIGCYSTCIGKETLDEAPFAYRSLGEIEGLLGDTVELTGRLLPVYNYKAGREKW